MSAALIALDLVLLVLGALRLSRLVTTDSLPGQWWLQEPLYKKIARHQRENMTTPHWAKYVDGLVCPFCVGFWLGALLLVSLLLAGGPGDAAEWWRWLVGAFALNYVVGHVAKRLD